MEDQDAICDTSMASLRTSPSWSAYSGLLWCSDSPSGPDAIYLNFCKTSDTVPHTIPLSKLQEDVFDEQTEKTVW